MNDRPLSRKQPDAGTRWKSAGFNLSKGVPAEEEEVEITLRPVAGHHHAAAGHHEIIPYLKTKMLLMKTKFVVLAIAAGVLLFQLLNSCKHEVFFMTTVW